MKFSHLKKPFEYNVPIRFLLPDGKYYSDNCKISEISQVSKYTTGFDGVKSKKNYVTIQITQCDDFDDKLTGSKAKKVFDEYDGDQDLQVYFEIDEQTVCLYSVEELIYYHQINCAYKIESIVFSLARTKTSNKCETNCKS